MDLGIIGFQRSGKTTIFNAVTKGHAETGSYGSGVQPNIGVVKVPDERLTRLTTLFRPRPDANYRILSLAEIRRARVELRGRDDESKGAASWYTLLYLQDSDYVLVDVARQQDGRYPLLDAYHETYPLEVRQISSSFGEFLERALASGNEFFWLNE